jgi:hypothetical protein
MRCTRKYLRKEDLRIKPSIFVFFLYCLKPVGKYDKMELDWWSIGVME